MMFELCFTRRYSMSHRLYNIKQGKCYVPHGHNEYVKVHLVATGDDRLDGVSNMSNQFETLKKTWHGWIDNFVDHTMQLSDQDPLLSYFKENEPENLPRLMITPGDPTTEVLAACFFSKINAFLKADDINMKCVRVDVEETPTNTVVFHGDPDQAISFGDYDGPDVPWWQRADMSINDL
ncbi:6-pyruvoyl trahydropterin synthase family protein [Pseudemcibacter aquimaris]|uniref:6-pyruvoyl trahydropterin synthase family protein n=2 Tax=Pseudemcibacter aquimaris TaxID=2857064 RepID=UPI0030B8C840